MTTHLIINADDLGANLARDKGIFQAFEHGVVTSASILANGPSFLTAAQQAKALGLPLGVHLNLSEGNSLTGEIAGLTDTHGAFLGKQPLRDCLTAGQCKRDNVYRELSAQIERVFEAGLTPDHLDSHQHFQLFGGMTTVLIELAREFDIGAMRTVLPADAAMNGGRDALGGELGLYRELGRQAHQSIIESRLKTTDGLWGMPLLNRLDAVSLRDLLQNVPPGRWELMTHPGYADANGGRFSGVEREVELQALTSPQVKALLAKLKTRFCSYGELPCAY